MGANSYISLVKENKTYRKFWLARLYLDVWRMVQYHRALSHYSEVH